MLDSWRITQEREHQLLLMGCTVFLALGMEDVLIIKIKRLKVRQWQVCNHGQVSDSWDHRSQRGATIVSQQSPHKAHVMKSSSIVGYMQVIL